MSTIPCVVDALQQVLGAQADCYGRQTGFVHRQRKLSGSRFVQIVVMSWLAHPSASIEEMTRTAGMLGVDISAQGLDQRFTPAAAQCLQCVLESAVSQVVSAEP